MALSSRREPNLTKIIFIILALALAVLGVLRGVRWFNEEYLADKVDETAATNLEEAQRLLDEGSEAEAVALLEPIMDRSKNAQHVIPALMFLADLRRKAGDANEALALLQRAMTDFPDSDLYPAVAVLSGTILEEAGRTGEAVSLYEKISEEGSPEMRAQALAGLARAALAAGRTEEALGLADKALGLVPGGSEIWERAADVLGQANVTLFFSPEPSPHSQVYAVESGDTVTGIGIKLNVTQGSLIRANDLGDGSSLHLGQRLKYTPASFQIVIERSRCRLYLLNERGLFKVYPTGLGRPGHETTLGRYEVGVKQKDPTWFKPGEGEIPPGDPRNELGTRWMPLVPLEEDLPTDLGIHGTINPETIGTFSSSGCARLLKEDVEELYDIVVKSTPVTIVQDFHLEGLEEQVTE